MNVFLTKPSNKLPSQITIIDDQVIEMSESQCRLKRIKRKGLSLRDKIAQKKIRYSSNQPADINHTAAPTPDIQIAIIPTPQLIESVVYILGIIGLLEYYTTCFDRTGVSRVIGRLAKFLIWSYNALHKRQLAPVQSVVLDWLGDILNNNYQLLGSYGAYLTTHVFLAPKTVQNYMREIALSFEWLVLFAPGHIRQPMANLEGISKVAKITCRNQTKLERNRRSDLTVQAYIRDKKIPPGGLAAMRSAVLQQVPWAKSATLGNVTEVFYQRFMQLLVAAIYLDCPNGRVGGIKCLKKSQGEEAVQEGFSMSTEFKTASTYLLQPVILGGAAKEIMQLYLTNLRPQVSKTSPPHGDEPLWLTYHGKQHTQLGRLVTAFFLRVMNIKTTTTTIRKLVETAMYNGVLKGTVTPLQQNSVRNVNGHSGPIVQRHYILKDRIADVANARTAFAAILPEPAAAHACVPDNSDFDVGIFEDAFGDDFGIDNANIDMMPSASESSSGSSSSNTSSSITSGSMNSNHAYYNSGYGAGTTDGSINYSDGTSSNSTSYGASSVPSAHVSSTTSNAIQGIPALSAQEMESIYALDEHEPELDWGIAHPDYKSGKQRVKWTSAEKVYLAKWYEQFKTEYPDAANATSKCWDHLRTDPYAVRIFHERHAKDNTRLRDGFRSYERDCGKVIAKKAKQV